MRLKEIEVLVGFNIPSIVTSKGGEEFEIIFLENDLHVWKFITDQNYTHLDIKTSTNPDHDYKLVDWFMEEEKLWTLPEVIDIVKKKQLTSFKISCTQPFVNTLSHWGAGEGLEGTKGGNRIGEISEIVKFNDSRIENRQGVTCGITSPQGLRKTWQLHDIDLGDVPEFKTHMELSRMPKVSKKKQILLTKKQKEDKEKFDLILLENQIRLVIFKKTMQNVKEPQIDFVLEKCLGVLKEDKYNRTVVSQCIEDACKEINA